MCCRTIRFFFDDNIILQSDILFILKNNISIIKNDLVKGAPDFIYEIISSKFEKHDTILKKVFMKNLELKNIFF